MSRLMVIGCGGVASVAVHKCCQNSGVFTELMIASRTKSKCDALKAQLEGKTDTVITTAQVDADKVEELEALIRSYKPDAVLNVALPYQDLTIMEACLRTGVDYIDTANYEAENTDDPQWRAIYEKRCKEKGFTAYFDYSWQWDLNERFKEAGLTALLGSGFDPGVTSVFSAYALKHYFDEIHTIDILDCNGGDHGYPFATNFNPEINLREVSANGSYWENGHWVETEPMEIKRKERHVSSSSRRDRISGKKYSRSKADPLLYDLWTELSDPYEMPGKCRHAFYFSHQLPGTGNRTDPVFKGIAAGSCFFRTKNCR